MKINRIQTSSTPAFKARLEEVIDIDGKVREFAPQLRARITKGEVRAYLNEYRGVHAGKETTMLQLGLYGGHRFDEAFSMPSQEANLDKFTAAYFRLQAIFKKYINSEFSEFGKDAFGKLLRDGAIRQ